MIPGEVLTEAGEIELNAGRDRCTLSIENRGDRPIQIGSHTHFFEVNLGLSFDRPAAYGYRLDIPAGTALRFEPGEERDVVLVAYGGTRAVYGMNGYVNGPLAERRDEALARMAGSGRKQP